CFFFQAEDGIRDKLVTGVQTCALPILLRGADAALRPGDQRAGGLLDVALAHQALAHQEGADAGLREVIEIAGFGDAALRDANSRSEERRVGKECKTRWSPED